MNKNTISFKEKVITFIFIAFSMAVIVLPNGWRLEKVPVAIIIFLFAVRYIGSIRRESIYFLLAGSGVSLIYLMVGSGETNDFTTLYQQIIFVYICLLYTSPSPRDQRGSRMPSSA